MIERIRIAFYSLRVKAISPKYHMMLQEYNDYYAQLTPSLQSIFLKRVYISSHFIKFIPVEFTAISVKMKILITSALIQITFGLDNFILKRFKKIYVVPNTYSFAQFPALLGHVDYANNTMALSWPSVKEGFIIPDDAMNVALHEMAHALHGENKDGLIFNRFFSEQDLEQFKMIGIEEIYKIRNKRHPYLRDYAGLNLKELFSVSIECFFEQPELFKEKVPGLYQLLVNMLKQDPCQKSNPINKQIV
jgi:Mlc titration factor MtfA (ptsG expression regulator)